MRQRPWFAVKVATTIIGAVVGTAALCLSVPAIGVVGWIVSIVSLIRLFSAKQGTSVAGGCLIGRVLLACVFVFCLTVLVAMAMASMANPGALGEADILIITVIAAIGAVSGVAAALMTWQ